MIIEVSYAEYKKWNSRHTITERSRKAGKEYQFLSLDAVLNETDDITLLECLRSAEDMEAAVISEMIMDELKKQLFAWKPWAVDLLAYYLAEKRNPARRLWQKSTAYPSKLSANTSGSLRNS